MIEISIDLVCAKCDYNKDGSSCNANIENVLFSVKKDTHYVLSNNQEIIGNENALYRGQGRFNFDKDILVCLIVEVYDQKGNVILQRIPNSSIDSIAIY